MENLNVYCSCAGSYTTVTPKNDMMSYLKTFQEIADYYDMTLLKQILQQYVDWNKYVHIIFNLYLFLFSDILSEYYLCPPIFEYSLVYILGTDHIWNKVGFFAMDIGISTVLSNFDNVFIGVL